MPALRLNRWVTIALLVASVAWGCTSSTHAADTPELEVGGSQTDGTGFVTWPDDGSARPTVIFGPQGGYHIWVSFRTRQLQPTGQKAVVVLHRVDDGGLIAPGPIKRTLNLKPINGADEFDGMTAFVKSPCDVRDRQIRVDLTTTDTAGASASDSAVITPVWTGACP